MSRGPEEIPGSGTDTLDFIFMEIPHSIDDDPRERATKVDKLMHYEGHDSCCQDVVLHVEVPCHPQTLRDIKMDIIFRYLLELTPKRIRRRRE